MRLALLAALMLACGPAAYAGNPYCGPTYSRSYTPYKAPYVAPVTYQKQIVYQPIVVPVPYAYEKPLALQGSTHYGFVKATEPYQPLNAPLYFDKGIRLQEQTLSVIQAGREAFESTLSQKIQADKEVAEAQIAANGMAQFAKEFFAGQARLKELSLANSSGEGVLRATAEPTSEDAVISTFCAKCHGQADFVNTAFASLSLDRQEEVVARVAGVFEDSTGETVHDETKRMPLAADGKSPGKPLPLKYQRLLQNAVRQE